MEDKIVSFDVAKLAKEKGFDKFTLNFYFEDSELRENSLQETTGMDYGSEFLENWNDEWVTKKNGDRCFGCSKSNGYLETFSAPTQSLLQRWLREIHNIDIVVIPKYKDKGKFYGCSVHLKDEIIGLGSNFNSYELALEIGLQHALTSLV